MQTKSEKIQNYSCCLFEKGTTYLKQTHNPLIGISEWSQVIMVIIFYVRPTEHEL